MSSNVSSGEYLAAVYNQISQTVSCAHEFGDDYADKTQTDIGFHDPKQKRNTLGDDDQSQGVPFISVKSADEHQFIRISLFKSGINRENAAKNYHRDGGNQNHFHGCPEPHQKERGQC